MASWNPRRGNWAAGAMSPSRILGALSATAAVQDAMGGVGGIETHQASAIERVCSSAYAFSDICAMSSPKTGEMLEDAMAVVPRSSRWRWLP